MVKKYRDLSKTAWFLFVVCFIFSACFNADLQANPYNVGKYKVAVDVRTSLMKIIPHAYVKCKLSWSNSIKVSVSAPGYLPEEKEIPIQNGIVDYSALIQLQDKPKQFEIRDFNHKPIMSAYIDLFQGSTPTNLYSVKVFVPQKTWPDPSPKNIKINQPGYGWPIEESCEISEFGEFYKAEMIINRAVLDDPHDELLIYVNTGQTLRNEIAPWWLNVLKEFETTSSVRAHKLARTLIYVLPAEIQIDNLPVSISKMLGLKNRFQQLHQKP
ncbi:MAG: hypothetical protein ACQETH_16210 [Candidatus Rifleibacteriota bacterium]